MSHSFIDPKNNYYNVNNNSDAPQKKIDPVAQLKWLSTPQVHGGWGLFNQPVQMSIQDEKQGDKTFKVPSGWGLNKIANHLGVTVQDLIETNQDKIKTWGDVQGFSAGEIINIPSNHKKETTKSETELILDTYVHFKSGIIGMPEMARSLLPYLSTNVSAILDIFDSLPWSQRDNLAYALAANSSDSELKSVPKELLNRMSSELSNPFSTTSWTENSKQKERIKKVNSIAENKMLNEEKNITQISTTNCWDSISNTNVSKIHPTLKPMAFKFINTLDKTHNIKIRVYQGLRTYEEQNELYSKGRDEQGNIVDKNKVVTNAKGGQSFHNFGLAIDVVEIKDGKALWENTNWELIAKIGKECGFKWGGDWTGFVDKPHFEYTMDYSYNELQSLKEQGKWNL